jgi:hypothetical protein
VADGADAAAGRACAGGADAPIGRGARPRHGRNAQLPAWTQLRVGAEAVAMAVTVLHWASTRGCSHDR